MRGGYDPDRASWILLDAIALGDTAAAKKWGCHRRTIEGYRARVKTDEQLAGLLAEKRREAETDLANLRVRFLRRALKVLEVKIQAEGATVYEIAGAVKIVGDLHQVALTLGEDERPDCPDPEAAEAESGSSESTVSTH